MTNPFRSKGGSFEARWQHYLETMNVTESGCWEWTGPKRKTGYGVIGRNGKSALTHRVAYELARGPVPAGMCVCHSCDNPACINPAHLWIGTQGDNRRDCAAKGRNSKPDVSGERNPNAKLTREQVSEIRRRYEAGETNQSALAREYGVIPETVRCVVLGLKWRAEKELGLC